jgi:ubiquinone/menaquinone biosynthesis C-methylase UbiE
MSEKSIIELQAQEHEIINPNHFESDEEYVIHLMHLADYTKAQAITNGKDVLDLGCNSGYGTDLLSGTAKSIVGVDVSPLAIATAIKKFKKSNAKFRLVDGVSLPFNDNSFDVVTSFQVIEHLVDYDNYFNEIKRVLRPNGVLVLTTPNAEIRVKHGAKPWNRFHIHEFRVDEFGIFLQKYFLHSQVIGQLADGITYTTEYQRCISAREASGPRNHSQLKTLIRALLPDALVMHLRTYNLNKRKEKAAAGLPVDRTKYSLNDFFYQESNIDSCLSLVSCCSNIKAEKEKAIQAFLASGN